MIDELPISPRRGENYSYSEGLYTFKENGLMGYKNLDREVVIEPIYEEADPFLNNVARVLFNGTYGFIDRLGNFISYEDCYNEMRESAIEANKNIKHTEYFWRAYYDFLIPGNYTKDSIARVSFADGKYEIRDFANRLCGYITTIDNYTIDDDTRVKDIDFNNIEKTKVKK